MLSTTIATAALIINEIMSANVGNAISPAGNFDSWIEIYNPSDQSIDLAGFTLSQNAGSQKTWVMPNNIGVVPPQGFKVIWLGSNDIRTDQAPFKLDCDGGTISLTDPQGALVCSEQFPQAISYSSWARKTDGATEWGWTDNPTPEATNNTATFADERLEPPVVSTGSCLFQNAIQVSVEIPDGATLVYTTDGSLPVLPQGDIAQQNPWTNFVKNGDCEGTDATCLISRDADGTSDQYRILDGVGYENSRGIRIHAIANRDHDYDAQLFVYTPEHIWRPGEQYRFRMKVRADKPTHISAQTHTTPHNYIYWSVLDGTYQVDTQWTEIEYVGTVTKEQAGVENNWWSGEESEPKDFQTIAFNLNDDKQDNYIYFDDVSWELKNDTNQDLPNSQISTDGQFNIAQTSSLRFRLFRDGYLPSAPVTRSYIKNSNAYSLPVISIVGDQKFFNDPKIGFDCDGDGTNGKTGNGQTQPRNYNMPWDRPAHFSLLSPQGEMLFNQDVNISVSGGWTRSQRYRSFKLKSNKIFDGQNRFDYSFFSQKPYIRNKALLVRNGGNDIWVHNARFIDPALQTIVQRAPIDVDLQSYQPVIEYVNGQLRGVLNLRETNNDKFVYANFGYDDEEIDMFENFTFTNGNDSILQRIFYLAEHINDNEAYQELQQHLDIDEFTNYMAIELFLCNDDWPDNNIKAFRPQDGGKYRFVLFDLDYSFSLQGRMSDENSFNFFQQFSDMAFVKFFCNLLKHPDYRRKFIDTFSLIAGAVFLPDRANAIVDELLLAVQPMTRLMQQTMSQPDGNQPDRAAATIKQKLNGRAEKMAGFIRQSSLFPGLSSPLPLSIQTDVPEAKITVNGITIPGERFQGYLFTPLQLLAIPPAGHTFVAWKKGDQTLSTSPDLSITDAQLSGAQLTATFAPDSLFPPVRVNEVSAANSIFVNEYFKRNDWIELYNTTDEPIDVEGMFLSDHPDHPFKYCIDKGDSPAATIIQPHQYLVVWCDKLQPMSELHAAFKLDADGGDVLLTAADKSWNDCFSYLSMPSDQSAGRYPDGDNRVVTFNRPTIHATNLISSYAEDIPQLQYDPIPTSLSEISLAVRCLPHTIQVQAMPNTTLTLFIYNPAGQLIHTAQVASHDAYTNIPLPQLQPGTYIARITDTHHHRALCKFVAN